MPQYIAIDIGNTRSKIWWEGAFAVQICDTASIEEVLREVMRSFAQDTTFCIGWLSTSQEIQPEKWALAFRIQWIKIDANFPFPFPILYATPKTLGTDRVVGSYAAYKICGAASLVISAGTALTYDYRNAAGEYCGGAIAPGLKMRFRALHEFTARLPLIEEREIPKLIGDSTKNSLLSGVINGMCAEIDAMITRFREEEGEMNVFLTGGDADFLAQMLKNVDFSEEKLVLKGILELIHHFSTS